ncbi:DoxX family protein [Olleya sp. YS]|uniref:DoxX family protein n=1 Tax=Olleya sp. YS TaxID=3028318 RepID=UPI0024345A20|nr:DoxX family protein [Olleya sp. YS]WGD34531.1 DoxX family protein [Olleya sp. YS]
MSTTDYIVIALKIIVALSIINVWVIQPNKKTKWRGGNADNIVEEFKAYGLSKSFCYGIGFLKVSLALLLLVSIKFNSVTLLASSGLALLLLGSIAMHIKIKDPLYMSFPAFLFVVLNVVIIALTR